MSFFCSYSKGMNFLTKIPISPLNRRATLPTGLPCFGVHVILILPMVAIILFKAIPREAPRTRLFALVTSLGVLGYTKSSSLPNDNY